MQHLNRVSKLWGSKNQRSPPPPPKIKKSNKKQEQFCETAVVTQQDHNFLHNNTVIHYGAFCSNALSKQIFGLIPYTIQCLPIAGMQIL